MKFSSKPAPMTLIRDVRIRECWWLPRDFKAGETLWTFHGHTYGAVDTNSGRAMSEQPGENPFFQIPYDALQEQANDARTDG